MIPASKRQRSSTTKSKDVPLLGCHPNIDERVIAGVRAFEYRCDGGPLGVQEAWFAPSLGCVAVSVTHSTWNDRGYRTSEFHKELKSIRLGQPDDSTFRLPAGFYMKPPHAGWPYIWMDELPERRGVRECQPPTE